MNTKVFQKIGDTLSNNSPTILTGLGVAGLLSTVILAVKATPKAMQLLDDENERLYIEGGQRDYPKPLNKKDVIILTYKCYIPAAIMGGITIACILSANKINLRRNAALASVYSISEKALKEYQSKVIERIGAPKEREIRDDIAKEKLENNPVVEQDIICTGKGETLCYEALSGRYFKSDREKINKAVNEINKNLRTEMFVTLNELYYELGLPDSKLGETLGWHIDRGYLDPHFSSHLAENGTPCLVLDFNIEPKYSPYVN